MEGASAMVVDIRDNHGGSDVNAKRIASAFADRERLFMTSQTRNGPRHSDYDSPTSWYIIPDNSAYTGPVMLLAHRHTVSSAEVFALAMRTLPHVVHVGDTTSGAFSNTTFERQLPNGWVYRLSHQLFLSADGVSYEGTGLAPAILVRNTKQDIERGQDVVLERALNSLAAR